MTSDKKVREFLLLKLYGAYNGQCFEKPYTLRDRDWNTAFKRKDYEQIDVVEKQAHDQLQSELKAAREENGRLKDIINPKMYGYTKVLEEENAQLKKEIEFLRRYGNKDCIAMAEEAMAKKEEEEL